MILLSYLLRARTLECSSMHGVEIASTRQLRLFLGWRAIDLPAGTSSDDNISRITCCLSELVIIYTVEARSLCEVLVVV